MEQLKKYYDGYQNKPYFPNLVEYLASELCVVHMMIGDENVIVRKMSGATDPAKADL